MSRHRAIVALIIVGFLGAIVWAMSSSNYTIAPSAATSSGGYTGVAGYVLYSASGQSAIGRSSSASYNLCAGILCGTFAGTRAKGDVNGDGVIDLIDARLCLQIATGYLAPSAAQREAADVDDDGNVDETDAQILSEYIIGMRTTLP